MKKRTLGKSEIEISELSLGCMSLPLNINEAKPIVDTAIDAGINYFDTADLYNQGDNERIIGEILKPHRQQLILATKVGNRFEKGQEGWSWDASASYIKNAVKDSLQRLQTDYIDVYQLHGGTIEDNLDEVIATFEELKKEGLIRAYGISSIRPNVFLPFAEKGQAVSNMMQYSMLDRRAEEWFPALSANGVSVVTRGSIAKGLLTKEWRTRLQTYMSYSQQELETLLSSLEEQYGSLHSLAIAFNLQHQAIASTVIGASSKQQLLENIAAYDAIKNLPALDTVEELLKKDLYTEHR
ncbi:aldo/keto reductase [Metasolibacillus sp.]|uniref:aldo/keto reductase n=1 Tax=Metasolibacillus sp. TaxID=2703680 RepID=UPI0025E89054|nr:aldo/keto reductase [Metasolibacillus sp.]MCT6923669.1 aldo/keto reductase [Metasolibacillus sp.]MCT6939608.1 aldo/keto reductase [Metasolibacillus sp.]